MDAPAPPRTRPNPGLDAGWAETTARLRAFIARRVDNPYIADDITQDVLTRCLAGGALDTVDNPTGWLYRAARNAVIDHYRLRRRHQPLLAADERWTEPEVGDSGPNDATRELARCLQPLVEQLPPIYRDALTRVDLHGETHQQAAAATGISRVRHEITRPAWPPPTPRPPHRLLRRAHRQHWRDPLLPARRSPLRLQLPLTSHATTTATGRRLKRRKPSRPAVNRAASSAGEKHRGTPQGPIQNASYNVTPTSDVYVVLDDGEARKVDLVRWGFVPAWAKDLKIGNRIDQRTGRVRHQVRRLQVGVQAEASHPASGRILRVEEAARREA